MASNATSTENLTEEEQQEAKDSLNAQQRTELEQEVRRGNTVVVLVQMSDGTTGVMIFSPSEATDGAMGIDSNGSATQGEGGGAGGGGDTGPAAEKSLSKKGTDLLKSVEGFRPTPYDDDTGEEINEWVDGATIGYGHLIGEKEWDQYANGITSEQASQLLAADLAVAENAVRANITITISQNQYDALVLLAYNIGSGAFASSSAANMINNPGAKTEFSTLRDAWVAWKHQNCQASCSVSQGLVNRRQAEWNIYSRGVYEQW